MSLIPMSRYLTALLFVILWWGSSSCTEAGAHSEKLSPKGKVIFYYDKSVVDVNIGRRKNLSEGNAASLRALARLVRRYPRCDGYDVLWSFKLKRGYSVQMFTSYDKTRSMIVRAAKATQRHPNPANALQYDGVSTEELLRIVRQGGSFREIEKVAAGYSQGQEYWR